MDEDGKGGELRESVNEDTVDGQLIFTEAKNQTQNEVNITIIFIMY